MAARERLLAFLDYRSRVILALIGVGLVYGGYQEFRVASGTTAAPRAVELEQLEAGRVPENNHLRIGEHLALYHELIYATKDRHSEDPFLQYSIYPIVSPRNPVVPALAQLPDGEGEPDRNAEQPRLDHFKVLVLTKRYSKASDLPQMPRLCPNVEGLVINRIRALKGKETTLLREEFPGLDLNEVLILEDGREPASWAKSLGLLGGGAAALLLALVSAVLARFVKPGSGPATAEPVVSSPLPGLLDVMAIVFMLGLFFKAGWTATWLAMSLFSGDGMGMVLVLLLAFPFNLFFLLHLRGVIRAEPNEIFFGLRRGLWLVVVVIAYLATVGSVLFSTFCP